MEKINLDGVTDNHKYKDLALLFDRADFQKDLQELKKIIKNDGDPDLFLLLTKETKGYEAARALAQKYKYPLGFTRAIYYASSFGKVTDNEVRNCYSKVLIHPLSDLDTYTLTLTKKDLVIFIDPYAIKHNKKIILDDISLVLDGVLQTTEPLPRNHPLNKDPKSEIKRDRDWYWEKMEKSVTSEIILEDYIKTHREKYNEKSEKRLTVNFIDKAINRYRILLQSKI